MTEQSKLDEIKYAIIRRVAELPDRTTPDEYPNMMLVTNDELSVILDDEIEAAVEAEVQRRIEEIGEKPVAYKYSNKDFENLSLTFEPSITFNEVNNEFPDRKYTETPLYAAPPQALLQAAIDQAREEVGLAIQSKISKESSGIGEASYKSGMRDACGIALDQIGKPLGDSHE